MGRCCFILQSICNNYLNTIKAPMQHALKMALVDPDPGLNIVVQDMTTSIIS